MNADPGAADGFVTAVSVSATHTMTKPPADSITLLEGLGVAGDAHHGTTVKRRDPARPNLRQVHLIHSELHVELATQGFPGLRPGQMGENVTTKGVDLLGLPVGTKLRIGDEAVVEVTGLRNPCAQLDGIRPGLMKATLDRDEAGELVLKSGIMGIVLAGGTVSPGDAIEVQLPPEPHVRLRKV